MGVLLVLAFGLPSQAVAADQTVTATVASQFVPPDLTIDVGDTVTWNNAGGFHDVAFDDGSFRQPPAPSSAGWSVSRQFTGAGDFLYYCTVHGGPNGVGMAGSVTVNAAAQEVKLVRAPLALAYRPCDGAAANRLHGGALDHAACSPPAQVSEYLTVGTFAANSRVTRSVSSIRLRAEPGDPGTTEDDANVQIVASITDVRERDGLADYAGELRAEVPLQITDEANGPGGDEPATGATAFTLAVPCATTQDPGAGSECSITTTADAVSPGTVVEGKRSAWEVGRVQVFDGGADGQAATADNTLFMTQAVFVP
jgi:plastocyanin